MQYIKKDKKALLTILLAFTLILQFYIFSIPVFAVLSDYENKTFTEVKTIAQMHYPNVGTFTNTRIIRSYADGQLFYYVLSSNAPININLLSNSVNFNSTSTIYSTRLIYQPNGSYSNTQANYGSSGGYNTDGTRLSTELLEIVQVFELNEIKNKDYEITSIGNKIQITNKSGTTQQIKVTQQGYNIGNLLQAFPEQPPLSLTLLNNIPRIIEKTVLQQNVFVRVTNSTGTVLLASKMLYPIPLTDSQIVSASAIDIDFTITRPLTQITDDSALEECYVFTYKYTPNVTISGMAVSAEFINSTNGMRDNFLDLNSLDGIQINDTMEIIEKAELIGVNKFGYYTPFTAMAMHSNKVYTYKKYDKILLYVYYQGVIIQTKTVNIITGQNISSTVTNPVNTGDGYVITSPTLTDTEQFEETLEQTKEQWEQTQTLDGVDWDIFGLLDQITKPFLLIGLMIRYVFAETPYAIIYPIILGAIIFDYIRGRG